MKKENGKYIDYVVEVHEERTIEVLVRAESEEDARRAVEERWEKGVYDGLLGNIDNLDLVCIETREEIPPDDDSEVDIDLSL